MLTTTTPRAIARLAEAIAAVVQGGYPAGLTATLVAGELRDHLPGPEVLTNEQRLGRPDRYTQHVLHVAPDGSFSIVAVVWRPGQETPIHDHVSWCVVGVIEGAENETVFRLRDVAGERWLEEVATAKNGPGSVSAFAPPGDIHLVRNTGTSTGISLHVYGADIGRLGSSIRRCYDLPLAPRS